LFKLKLEQKQKKLEKTTDKIRDQKISWTETKKALEWEKKDAINITISVQRTVKQAKSRLDSVLTSIKGFLGKFRDGATSIIKKFLIPSLNKKQVELEDELKQVQVSLEDITLQQQRLAETFQKFTLAGLDLQEKEQLMIDLQNDYNRLEVLVYEKLEQIEKLQGNNSP